MHNHDIRKAILARAAALKAVAHHTSISQNHRLEALTAGYVDTKFASVSAKYGDGVAHLDMFDQERMAKRMIELTDQATSDVVELQTDGVSVNVEIVKDRVQPTRYSDVSYRVNVQVYGLGAFKREPIFLMPQKLLANGHEPFRVDSAHDRRVDRGEDAPVGLSGQLLEAKLVKGHWHGGLYIYDRPLQENDADCLAWVRHSLTRAIHRSLTPIVRCDVFRPIQPSPYEAGVWRVRLRVHPDAALPRTKFALPALAHHIIPMNADYFADIDVGLMHGGRWEADVYPSGQKGIDNMMTAREVQSAFLRAIEPVVQQFLAMSPYSIKYRPAVQFASTSAPL
ncbi:hypothetical protein [Cupriavidus sp. SW-Y-13]|uniref:hypothetical protein n=1 Tax=Cupriavidus sp. SW-Y-13 TaxID=2653854 RepID=UPI0013662318|nr:hypothetical protein [Cupriavidus sp. SW-Y-13]MWL88594.1 hypothetical protein [Cupriavidus sp. SW-Y-13]